MSAIFDSIKDFFAAVSRYLEISGALYGTLVLIALVLLFILLKKIGRRLFRPIKTARMQLVMIDQNNGEAARNIKLVPGQTTSRLTGSMGRSIIGDTYLTFYLLDRNNKPIRLKTPSQNISQMKEGDLCSVTYQGENLISYQKTGSIHDEDQKPVHFQS